MGILRNKNSRRAASKKEASSPSSKAPASIPLKNCTQCGKVFVTSTGHELLCKKCEKKDREMTNAVRLFIRTHPNRQCTAEEIMDATGASPKFMLQMLRMGVLDDVNIDVLTFPCARCGSPITEGRYCKNCTEVVAEALAETAKNAHEREERLKNLPRMTRRR